MKLLQTLTLVLAFCAIGHGATVPIGPPATFTGDVLPTPVRTLWVDRASRGGTCSDSNSCTEQTAPCCTLARANQVSQAGDRIEVRAGANGGASGYWEADDVGGKWNVATLSVNTKGTARCVAGACAGWGCTSDAGCPGSTCDYRPVVWHAYAEPDGSRAHIDPMGNHPPEYGATACNGGVAGRFIGINFNNPSCTPTNDRLECYGGTEEGKPCGTCAGGGTCGANPWYQVFDGFTISNWNYWDSRNVAGEEVASCSEKATNITGQSCGGKIPVGITFQNNLFQANGGFGVFWMNNAAGNRLLHNTFRDNITRGYTTQVNHWQPQDQTRNRVTYIWGNRIINGSDNSPNWSIPGKVCLGSATLTCLDGPNIGASCTGEGLAKECGYGHCGGMCMYDAYYNNNPRGQGYSCECTDTAQCASGLTCQASLGNQVGGNTEGRGIIVDRGGNGSALDIRNNVIALNQGDCISVFLSDMGSAAKGKGFIANNTCYHNAEKGASYAEINAISRYLNVANNIIAPGTQAFCKSGSAGGQVCATPGQNGGVCGSNGTGCEIPTYFFYDNADLYSSYAPDQNVFGGTTNWSNKNLFYVPSFLANPISFEFAAPGSGESRLRDLTQFRSYGTSFGLVRDQQSLTADPQFLSVDPNSPNFLRIAAGSPAVGAGDSSMAPPFDIDGVPRGAAPSIGAFEVASGTTIPTTTTTTSTTTSTSSTTTTTTSTSSTTTLPPTTTTSTSSSTTAPSTTSTTLAGGGDGALCLRDRDCISRNCVRPRQKYCVGP